MSPEAQRIAIAEACGWKMGPVGLYPPGLHPASNVLREFKLPDYLSDLNAMHEAEKTFSPAQSEQYVSIMDDVLEIPSAFYGTARRAFLVMHATAGQRAETFLRTMGKWSDSP